jgi:hypothetical protein
MTVLDRVIFLVGIALGVYLILSELWQLITGGDVCNRLSLSLSPTLSLTHSLTDKLYQSLVC